MTATLRVFVQLHESILTDCTGIVKQVSNISRFSPLQTMPKAHKSQ